MFNEALYEKFLSMIPRDGWRLERFGTKKLLRRNGVGIKGECPLSSFRGLDARQYLQVAEQLGFGFNDTCIIIYAADDTCTTDSDMAWLRVLEPERIRVRTDLLNILKPKEDDHDMA